MFISGEVVVYFLALFFALVGFIGVRVIDKLNLIEKDLKTLLVNHGGRISVNEVEIRQLKEAVKN